jgi:hypothetical protein
MNTQTKPVTLVNLKNGETWLCPDFKNRKQVDGEIFVQVCKSETPNRLVWVNLGILKRK